jgi:hypothetical protein
MTEVFRGMSMMRVAAVLLVVYAGLLLIRAVQIWGAPPAPTLATVAALSLPLAFGLWRGAWWAWWGTLLVLLLMLGWLAVFALIMLATSEGRGVLQAVLSTPSLALASFVLELVIVVLLLLPGGRAEIHSGAAA